MLANILIEIKAKQVDQTYTYHIPTQLEKTTKIGIRVQVPFGHQTLEGFVLSIEKETEPQNKLKDIYSIIDENPVLNEEMIELGSYLSKKTFSTKISAYQSMLPSALKANDGFIVNKKFETYLYLNQPNIKEKLNTEAQRRFFTLFESNEPVKKSEATTFSSYLTKSWIEKKILKEVKEEIYRINKNENIEEKTIQLNQEQQIVIKQVLEQQNKFHPFLLYGVTGSGKTEVYMHIIEQMLTQKKEAIVLVPEISLTPQLVDTFSRRFGSSIAILHSRLSDGEKYDEWRKIERKEVSIVIGARSAIFAPFTNLGIIIIDEEHSTTYKQEHSPRYHAIDIALYRGKTHQCPVLLGSATPSIESFTRAKQNIYELLTMKERVNHNLPEVNLIDMKEEMKHGNRLFSSLLKQKMNECFEKNEQIILLLNRRGYSTIVTCHKCGFVQKCPNCDIPLTYHRTTNKMMCHYCNFETYKYQTCPTCQSNEINEFGMGTEKLEQEVNQMFPNAKTIRMDVDTTRRKGAHEKLISEFRSEHYNVLIGTQMIAKGLDFPKVTLVGVINGDASLNIPDFRSGERTYQLLSQVAGRAGRSELTGSVVIQGFNINHYSMKRAKNHDYDGFYQEEMKIRKILKYPPFYNLCLIRIIGNDDQQCLSEGEKIKQYLRDHIENISLLGPSMAPIPKVNNRYFVQLIIKFKQTKEIYESLQMIQTQYRSQTKVSVEIDLNPIRI